jgi:hypothetical protein
VVGAEGNVEFLTLLVPGAGDTASWALQVERAMTPVV